MFWFFFLIQEKRDWKDTHISHPLPIHPVFLTLTSDVICSFSFSWRSISDASLSVSAVSPLLWGCFCNSRLCFSYPNDLWRLVSFYCKWRGTLEIRQSLILSVMHIPLKDSFATLKTDHLSNDDDSGDSSGHTLVISITLPKGANKERGEMKSSHQIKEQGVKIKKKRILKEQNEKEITSKEAWSCSQSWCPVSQSSKNDRRDKKRKEGQRSVSVTHAVPSLSSCLWFRIWFSFSFLFPYSFCRTGHQREESTKGKDKKCKMSWQDKHWMQERSERKREMKGNLFVVRQALTLTLSIPSGQNLIIPDHLYFKKHGERIKVEKKLDPVLS